MKVAFYEPYAINTPHFERCLELMEKHINDGDDIMFIGCLKEFSTCDVNVFHFDSICEKCTQKCNKGLSLLTKQPIKKPVYNLKEVDHKKIKKFVETLQFQNIEDIKAIKYESFDVGYAVASSVISNFRNPSPDAHFLKKLFLKNFIDALKIYTSFKTRIIEEKIDRLYVFNGRFAHQRAAFRAAQSLGVDCYIHETSFNLNKYSIYKNALPHNIQNSVKLIKDKWEKGSKEQREKIGAQYYKDLLEGNVIASKYHYTKNQEKDLLPKSWDPKNQNIVIFNSSEDEFASIGDSWRQPIYENQIDGITRMVSDLEDREGMVIYLRVHPNLKNASKKILKAIYQIKGKNFEIIGPSSPISTYQLIFSASKVITFSSTVGIEAAYWNKPSIILGPSFYKTLGSNYTPQNHKEVIELIINEKLTSKNNIGALMYGYFVKTNGYEYRHYSPISIFEGQFKKTDLNKTGQFLNFRAMVGYKLQKIIKLFINKNNK